jgi:hypothetical protein
MSVMGRHVFIDLFMSQEISFIIFFLKKKKKKKKKLPLP